MENTACGDKCPFVKQGFCNNDSECPHYVESWWLEQQTGSQKLVKDCASKRIMIDSQIAFNRGIALQASIEKLEFRIGKLEALLEALIYQSKKFLIETEGSKNVLLQIPSNEIVKD